MRHRNACARLTASIAFAACVAAVTPAPLGAQPQSTQQETTVKIRMTLDGRTRLPAMLVNGAAARDFAALLPLELSLKDYASTEKIADLPKRLSIEGEPEGFAPAAGAIAYYAPWGNLAIFYRDFSHSAGLVQLGRLENASDVAALARAASVRIERDE